MGVKHLKTMIQLNNGISIPQMGVGTWTLRGETARLNVCLALQAGERHHLLWHFLYEGQGRHSRADLNPHQRGRSAQEYGDECESRIEMIRILAMTYSFILRQSHRGTMRQRKVSTR